MADLAHSGAAPLLVRLVHEIGLVAAQVRLLVLGLILVELALGQILDVVVGAGQ